MRQQCVIFSIIEICHDGRLYYRICQPTFDIDLPAPHLTQIPPTDHTKFRSQIAEMCSQTPSCQA